MNTLFFYLVTDLNNLVVEMGEEGLLENLQLVYLALAALAFLIGGLRSEGPARMFAIGMCMLMLIFFFRELEVEPNGPVSSYIKSHAFRWHEAVLVIGFAASIFSAIPAMCVRCCNLCSVARHGRFIWLLC